MTYLKIVKIGCQEFIFNILQFFIYLLCKLYLFIHLLIFFPWNLTIVTNSKVPIFLITWYCKEFLFQYFISNANVVVYSSVYNIRRKKYMKFEIIFWVYLKVFNQRISIVNKTPLTGRANPYSVKSIRDIFHEYGNHF